MQTRRNLDISSTRALTFATDQSVEFSLVIVYALYIDHDDPLDIILDVMRKNRRLQDNLKYEECMDEDEFNIWSRKYFPKDSVATIATITYFVPKDEENNLANHAGTFTFLGCISGQRELEWKIVELS